MFSNLRTKIWSLFTSIIAIILLVAYFYFPSNQYRYLISNFNDEVQYVANTIALGVEVALSEENFEGISKVIEYARKDDRMNFVAVIQIDDANKKEVFKIFPEDDSFDLSIVSSEHIVVKRASFASPVINGEIIVGFTTKAINTNIANLKNTTIWLLIVTLIVLTIVIFIVANNITRPLDQLKNAAFKVGQGDLTFDMNVESRDEIGQLSAEFSQMVSELRKSKESIESQQFELEEKNQELQALNEDKNNLIHIVAHDLRSPLNQVLGLVEILKIDKKNWKPEQLEMLDQIGTCSTTLGNMINKILDVEAIESKSQNLSLNRIDLIGLLQSMCVNLHAISNKKNINMAMDTQLKEAYCEVDEQYCKQVFQNLISNAIKFSPEKTKITVVVENINDSIVVRVKDEGPGIASGEVGLLFKKYQKLSNRPTANEQSTGIGLSIVKKYVEMMNGEVSYENNSPNGSIFSVSLKSA